MRLLKPHDHCSTGGGEEIETDPLPARQDWKVKPYSP